MSFLPPGENIIETKKCRISGKDFFVTDKDLEFYDKISPVFGGQKYLIPSPTLSPDERQRRRLAFRNERKLYHRKCDKTGNQIISIYSSDKPYKVYDQKVWWSDDWNPFAYGKNFDFNDVIFKQFLQFKVQVPRMNFASVNNENCPYANQLWNSKNVYMSFDIGFSQDTYYSNKVYHSETIIDSTSSRECKFSCFLTDCFRCERCFGMLECKNCIDSSFNYDCEGCHDVYFCSHLRNVGKYIFNKPATDIEIKKLRENLRDTRKLEESFNVWRRIVIGQTYHRGSIILNSEECVGEYITNSRNCFACFDVDSAENLKYCATIDEKVFNSIDITNGVLSNFSYEGMSITGGNILFSNASFDKNNRNLLYCDLCTVGNSDCFFSVGLHNHEHHCILNKSYSIQEYETLCGKIIDHMRSTGEWGEFFPHELSPFGYDETVAQEYFPMTESEVREKGWNWKGEEETSSYHGPYYVPLSISQYDERMVGFDTATKNINECLAGIIECEVTNKPFKIIKQELAFYIENGIPIPTKHPDQRHKERMNLRNPRTLYDRNCADCGKGIVTTYAPDRTEKVYCEACYRKLVY